MIDNLPGAPFDLVLDVGGNIGEWAQHAHAAWPDARVVSFEPLPALAEMSSRRALGDWEVAEVAISDGHRKMATLYVCENQHSASTMMEPGGVRGREFGIADSYVPIQVETAHLDDYLPTCEGRERILVKIDVEGHEGQVLLGAPAVLHRATTVIVECQQDPDVFIDAPSPRLVDELLDMAGLSFWGVAGVLCAPSGRVLQFDGVWTRA